MQRGGQIQLGPHVLRSPRGARPPFWARPPPSFKMVASAVSELRRSFRIFDGAEQSDDAEQSDEDPELDMPQTSLRSLRVASRLGSTRAKTASQNSSRGLVTRPRSTRPYSATGEGPQARGFAAVNLKEAAHTEAGKEVAKPAQDAVRVGPWEEPAEADAADVEAECAVALPTLEQPTGAGDSSGANGSAPASRYSFGAGFLPLTAILPPSTAAASSNQPSCTGSGSSSKTSSDPATRRSSGALAPETEGSLALELMRMRQQQQQLALQLAQMRSQSASSFQGLYRRHASGYAQVSLIRNSVRPRSRAGLLQRTDMASTATSTALQLPPRPHARSTRGRNGAAGQPRKAPTPLQPRVGLLGLAQLEAATTPWNTPPRMRSPSPILPE